MNRYCIVKTSALGDIVHAFTALGHLNAVDPDSHITWIVEKRNAQLVQKHPFIDRVIPVETKKGKLRLSALRDTRYDALFDLQGNIKSGILSALIRSENKYGFAKPAEWPNKLFLRNKVAVDPKLPIREEYLALVQAHTQSNVEPLHSLLELGFAEEELVDEWKERGNAVIAPGAKWPSKVLSPKALVEKIPHGKNYLISWGTEEEKKLGEELCTLLASATLLPKLSLPALQHLIAEMELFVGMDSLPLHLAGETGVETLSFFCPSNAKKYAPPKGEAFQSTCQKGYTYDKRCRFIRRCNCINAPHQQ